MHPEASIARKAPPVMAPRVTVHASPRTVVGTDEWIEGNARFTWNTLRCVEGDCSLVAGNLPHFRKWAADHGIDWLTFCVDHLGAAPAFLAKLEEGVSILRATGHAGPITREEAVAAVAAQAVPLAAHGEATSKRVEKGTKGFKPQSSKGSDATSVGKRAKQVRDKAYLVDRIKRDRPDILDRMIAREFPSVRAAARAAGILKPLDPVRVAVRAVAKLTADERRAFVEAFDAAYPGELGKEVVTGHNFQPAEEGCACANLSADEAAAALEKPTRPRSNRTVREETCRQ
jgi:hypothetical protein